LVDPGLSEPPTCDVCRADPAALKAVATRPQDSDVLKACDACGAYWREGVWGREPVTLSEAGGLFPDWYIAKAPWMDVAPARLTPPISEAKKIRSEALTLGLLTLIACNIPSLWERRDGFAFPWFVVVLVCLLVALWARQVWRLVRLILQWRAARQRAR
jgi:hypothetical protein